MQFNCGNPCLDHCCHLQRNVTDLWDVTSPGQVMLALPSISTPIWAPVNSGLYHDSFGFACHGKHIPCLQLLLPFLKKTAVAFSASHTTRKTGMRRLIILRDEHSLSSRGSPAILQTPGGHIHGLRLAPSHPPEQLRMQEGQGQDSLRAPGGPTPHLHLGRAGLTLEWHHCPKRAPLCRAGQAPG